MGSFPRFPSWLFGVGLAVVVAGVGVGLWFLSPSTNKEFSFALLVLPAIAAMLVAFALLRGEAHQRASTEQLHRLASLLQVQASLEIGFATDNEDEPVDEVTVQVDWSQRDGPAIIRSKTDLPAPFDEEKRRSGDLVPTMFRISNTLGRDPANNVFSKITLPAGWEAYADDEFESILAGAVAISEIDGPFVRRSDRQEVTFSIKSISNATWYTVSAIWLRLPKATSGRYEVKYSISADRIPRRDGKLSIVVK